ncbi:MAG: penicillin-binding protein 2 [Actinobacteria bacterium]|nr:penicillin-binding protein 2 [Actinomycetota bacterium]MCG2802711.1 penicillin-binding protein 2 [Cellulomonas sp.]
MNTPLRRLAAMALAMSLILMGSVTWIQFFQANRLNNDPRNVRTLYREFGNARGPIVVAGTAVASSVAVDDSFGYQRQYAAGPLWSSVTGFYGITGRTELEQAANSDLTGRSDQLFFSRVRNLLTGGSPQGASVETTLLPAAQQAAIDALGDQQGAVVAIEPSTGKILALVSTPGFDPNVLASHDTAAASAAYQSLLSADGNPLLNKATQEIYAPGSTFKLVVASAALESGSFTADSTLAAPTRLSLPGTTATIGNFGGGGCGSDPITLADALRVSCNTAFAQLGMDVGESALSAQAKKFGFDDPGIAIPMGVATSKFPTGLTQAQVAQSSIGQYSVTASPMQMAMVAAAIANGGTLMKPYLVDAVRSADLSVVNTTTPQVYSQAISASTATTLTTMMQGVVTGGSGKAAQISGVAVAGKSGTAEVPNNPPNAWFTSFAPADKPQVAVAVFVKSGGSLNDEATGGKVAAPIAKAVMEAVLGR